MGDKRDFEFRATFHDMEHGLDVIHRSIDDLRHTLGRRSDDRSLMYFETAVAEIGNNALLHGQVSTKNPVRYVLRGDAESVVAWVTDSGPPVNGDWAREMPPATSEAGRGLALARSMLDTLAYKRQGKFNLWQLVKRL